jgi:pimeloyl-ACP methyl ester carboxylesterase
MSTEFRVSAAHATDVRAVVAEVKKRYPGRPVFLVGTSRGTLSAAHLAAALQGQVAGVVLTSSFFYEGAGRRARPVLASYDWSAIKVPLLFVHHRNDGCGATPYESAVRLAERFPLVSVVGGKPAESAACEPLAPHGFYGKEAPTVDAIAAWMLQRPFRKEID